MPRVCFCFCSVLAVVLASASVTVTESKEDEVVRVVVTLARACFCLSTCISTETEVNIEIEVVVWVVLVDVVTVESVWLGFIEGTDASMALSSILTESEVNKVVVVVVRVDIVGVVSTPTFHTISSSNGGVIVGRACFCWTADTELSEDTVTVVEVVLLVLVPDVIIVWVRVSFLAAGGLTQRGTWVVMLRLLSCHLSSSTSTHLGFKLP